MSGYFKLPTNQNLNLPELCNFIREGATFELEEIDGKSALFFAAINDYPKVVDALHSKGLDLNITDDEEKTAVFYASQNNSLFALCELIRAGARFELEEIDAKAALFFAAENDYGEVVKKLHWKNFNLDITDDEGKAPVFYASKNNSLFALCELIRSWAWFKLEEIDAKAALFFAAGNDYGEVVKELYRKKFDLNITDGDEKTAVFYANQNNSLFALCALIREGAWFELEEIDAKAALFFAAENDYHEVVKQLDKKNFDVNISDDEGKTPVFYASKNNSLFALCELIRAGARFELEEIDAKALLFDAAKQDNFELIKALESKGLDLDITDEKGKTILFYANKSRSMEVLCKLIGHGSEFDCEEIDVKSVFFYGAKNDHPEILEPLSRKGFDLSIADNAGRTAVFYGNRHFLEKFRIFENILVNKRDMKGRTALFYAVRGLSLEKARYLIEMRGNCEIKDNCNVSIFFSLVEGCISYGWNILQSSSQELFQQQQQLNALTNAIFDAVYCQAPLLFVHDSSCLPKSYIIFKTERVLKALDFAREQCLIYDDSKIENIEEISSMINSGDIVVERLLILLNQLGANPDAADLDGNTPVHYAAILPLFGGGHDDIINTLRNLKQLGASLNEKNHDGQSPLQFSLSSHIWKMITKQKGFPPSSIRTWTKVFKFLLINQCSCTNDSESIFHRIISLIQHGLSFGNANSRRIVLQVLVDILMLLSPKEEVFRNAVNKSDTALNTPLHLWASLTLKSSEEHLYFLIAEKMFENIMRTVLNHMLNCGAKLNRRNANDETPLHLCKTWTATNLLLDSGANPNDLDSSGCSPLLAAAKSNKSSNKAICFYPDVTEDLNTFWKSVFEKGFDPWITDKKGRSLLSTFIESEDFPQARALLEVGVLENYAMNDVKLSLLNIICQDESTHTHWKSNLVDIIFKSSTKSNLSLEQPLRSCFKNIVQYYQKSDSSQEQHIEETNDYRGQPPTKEKKNDKFEGKAEAKLIDDDLVHCKIAKQLILFGADIRIRDSSGISCLDIAKGCQFLDDLITKPINLDSAPIYIPWTSFSDKHRQVLAKVARRQECKIAQQIWYHRDPIGAGSFGNVFAGINEKDGREVAVKRMDKLHLHRPEDKREIKNLTALADCKQIVNYVSFLEDENFSYIILELMEGRLDDYLKECRIDVAKRTVLCKDVVMGLDFLHRQGIVHRDLKPQNILFKSHPEMCLKIADFGLSRASSSTSTTVYGTRAGTKCWTAPEVLKPKNENEIFVAGSDVFSCGLLLHYILSPGRHPFTPLDCVSKGSPEETIKTETNIMNDEMKGWDNSLHPEASQLIKRMLESNLNERPTVEEAANHPLFWSNEKKVNFLKAVGNQEEFECPRVKRKPPLTNVETDMEKGFGAIVKHKSWNSSKHNSMPDIYKTMTKGKGRSRYDTSSVVELVRFIRNVYEHHSENTFNTTIGIEQLLFDDFVFLKNFPGLVMEIYKAVTTHGWDKTRADIECSMRN